MPKSKSAIPASRHAAAIPRRIARRIFPNSFQKSKKKLTQLTANRANAKHSTGPKSFAGKAKSSLNAVRTGLTGRTILLPSEDAADYHFHCRTVKMRWNPEDDDEIELTQSIADTEWRLRRIPSLEAGIYALGRIEFAEKFASIKDPRVLSQLLNAQTALTYHKQLANLTIQEGRLRRLLEKDIAALQAMQEERKERSAEQLVNAAFLQRQAETENKPFNFDEFGFHFSEEKLKLCREWLDASDSGSRYDEAIARRRMVGLRTPKAA